MYQIFKDLSKKKLELLERLQVQTQLWLLNHAEEAFAAKENTLVDLERNDQALQTCEGEIGSLASSQEIEVYKKIRAVVVRLLELNQEVGKVLEEQHQGAEAARRTLLSEGTKMSDYVKSNGPYTEARRLKGSATRRGWQRGYGSIG